MAVDLRLSQLNPGLPCLFKISFLILSLHLRLHLPNPLRSPEQNYVYISYIFCRFDFIIPVLFVEDRKLLMDSLLQVVCTVPAFYMLFTWRRFADADRYSQLFRNIRHEVCYSTAAVAPCRLPPVAYLVVTHGGAVGRLHTNVEGP